MSTDVALPSEQQAQPPSIGTIIQQLRPELARALPKGMDSDRMARLALTVLRQTPELAKCSPQSFAGALLTAAALGLEPGVNGEAYLVPYKRECQLIVGYQGYAKLFWQNPLARHLDAQAVYANDDFEYEYGLNPVLRHKPAQGDRGEVIYYYAVATLSTGGSSFVVLTPGEVKRLRGGKVGTSGGIADPMRWMERKTVLRQLIKTLPRSTMLNAAMTADEELGSSLRARRAADSIVNTETGEIHEAEIVDHDDVSVNDPANEVQS
ncbi:MAG TPA: recombinase RecT [Aeromicrobium sp.]|nr:recombinase RecT [Aeromicrobium sp.]